MNTLIQGFALDELRVEPLTGLVTRPGGREKLDLKVMDVLVLMAGQAGQVVPREELLTRLWPALAAAAIAVALYLGRSPEPMACRKRASTACPSRKTCA